MISMQSGKALTARSGTVDSMPSEPVRDSFLSGNPGPEARLLLCCARTEIGPEIAARIEALARLPLDWDFVCASADKHRLTQLLFRNLSAICPASVPPEVRKRLRHRFYTNAGANLKLAHMLAGLVQSFGETPIPVIPFKGSVLAHETYGKLSLRQNYDVDLFIREQDSEKCAAVLANHGFRYDKAFDRAIRYAHEDDGMEVDVHWGFAPRYFHHRADFDGLWARTRTVSLPEGPVRTFGAEDFLVILCLQVMKDCWERRQQLEHLSKVCDIAEHLRAHPQMDWPRVFENARQDGLQRIVSCALILARELLEAKLPPAVVARIERDSRARTCARKLCRSLFTEDDTASPLENPYLSIGLRLRQLGFYLGIRERYRERIRHLGELFRVDKLAASDHASQRTQIHTSS